MYSVYTMPENTHKEILKNGHGEDIDTKEEEEEDNEHNSNGVAAEANGWCTRQGSVDGNRVILVGRIDPMEHVVPVYGTDEDGEDDDEDDGDGSTADRDGCGSDCSHGRSEEIAAESDGSILDAWLSALIGPETARAPGDPPAVALGPWGGLAGPFPGGGVPPSRPNRSVPLAPARVPPRPFSPAPAPEPAPGTFSLENLLRGGGRGGDDRPYCCPVCQQRFARYSHYARHLYFAHENEEKRVRPPSSGFCPELALTRGDVPPAVNSDVPAGPRNAPPSETFVYGDTLIFRGASQLSAGPPPVPAPTLTLPLPLALRPVGLGDDSAAAAGSGTPPAPRSYGCPVCEVRFPDRESRARHAQEHERFHCDVCGRGFRDEVERDHHTGMYAGKPAHRCDACGKCFHLMHSFARHVRTHTGEQPFSCEVCGKRFNDSGNMAKHMRTHTGDLPYPCPQCPRRFSDRANRAKHARTHHGDDRPYPCAECGRTFANGSNLARHQKAAHRPRPPPRAPLPLRPLLPDFGPGTFLLAPHHQLLAEGMDVGRPGAGRGGGVVC